MSSFVNDRSATRMVSGLIPGLYDKVARSDFSATEEDWTYTYQGKDMGVVRVTYTTAAHTTISTVERIS